jgi:hypothetical protein
MGSSTKRHPVRGWIPFLLVFLLIVVFFSVVMLGPKRPPTLAEQIRALHDHQAGYFFIEGEIEAQRAAPPGAHDWPSWIDHKTADVEYLGNGVWRAFGQVALAGDVTPVRPWEVYMAAPEATPLFVRLGDATTGDRAAALRQAQVKPASSAPTP